MKNYNEMAKSVFERRDKYNAERRIVVSKYKKCVVGAACCCLVALLGVGVLNGNQITTKDTLDFEMEFIIINGVKHFLLGSFVFDINMVQ